jgi:hypothetical protein
VCLVREPPTRKRHRSQRWRAALQEEPSILSDAPDPGALQVRRQPVCDCRTTADGKGAQHMTREAELDRMLGRVQGIGRRDGQDGVRPDL